MTRTALLDAAIASILEDGYARTTAAGVAQRAGVSRGAPAHHFGTRENLVAAAVEHLWKQRVDQLAAAVDSLPTGTRHTAQSLDLIWAVYSGPLFRAAFDLWAHARTDSNLHAQLTSVEREFDRAALQLAPRLFPRLVSRANFNQLVDVAVAAIRGLVLLDVLQPGNRRSDRQWPSTRAILASLLEGSARDVG